jgi:RNA polymerase sigma-70 factor (ECF subfamily)
MRSQKTKGLGPELVALVPELRARAVAMCGNRANADDVVQDTIERALRFAHQFERGTNLRAWAHQVLYSIFVSRWRRRRLERKALERLTGDPSSWMVPSALGAPDAGEGALTPSTRRKLDALPDGFREVVVMVDLEERSYRDAARELGIPVGTVMSRLLRGRKVLANGLAEAKAA